ncbi:MAG: hypothetical protein AAGC95_08820 [Pseudomonadota bacterium]
MIDKFKFLLKASAVSCLFVIGAASIAHAGGGTAAGTIQKMTAIINSGSGADLRVYIPTVTDNPDSCPQTQTFIIPHGDDNYEVITSMLIAAQHAQKNVSFYVEGCYVFYPKIKAIFVDS